MAVRFTGFARVSTLALTCTSRPRCDPHEFLMPKRQALVIEDDDATRDALRSILEDDGFDVICASALDSARAALRHDGVSVVLLDLLLRDETAADLLEELSQLKTAPPVVMVSEAPEARAIAKEYCVPRVGKPFDIDVVRAAVEVAMDLRLRPIRMGSPA